MSTDLSVPEPSQSVGRRLILKPRALLARLKSDPIIRNSAIYLVGSVLTGSFGYVFHFETGHFLGPSAYAVVASAIAALYLLTLPVIGLQLVSARFASIASARGQQQAILPMLLRFTSVSMLVGLPVAGLLALFAPQVSAFLNLSDRRIVYLLALASLFAIAVTVNRGALQGLRRFVALSGNMATEMISRLVFAAGLVGAGLGALGAIATFPIGALIAYGQSFFFLRSSKDSAGSVDKIEGIGTYAVLATIASIGINYLFSIDTLLAKHYLAADAAGVYAAGSVLARVVYFLGLSVAGVMFPEVASLHARNQAHFHVVDLALLLVGAMGAALIVAYFVAPGLVLLPYGASFTPARPYLGVFAVALTMLAIANLLINYFLSIARRTFIVPLFAACVLETALIAVFHQGIWQLLTMVVISQGFLALAMSAMYILDHLTARRPAA